MAFRQVLSNADVLDVSCCLEEGGTKYVAFSNCGEETNRLQISVSDGRRVWSKDYDEAALMECKEPGTVATLDAFLSELKSEFLPGRAKLYVLPQQVNLIMSANVRFELPEVTVHRSHVLLQECVVGIAAKADRLSVELVATKRRVSDLEQLRRDPPQGAASSSTSALYEPELKKKNPGPKMKRQQGRSLLNPSSRKRKAASGVVFDED